MTQQITLSADSATAINEALKAFRAEVKATKTTAEKTRTALTKVYAEVLQALQLDKHTEESYKQARAAILEQCKTCKTWPVNEKGEKVGYQKAMENSDTAVWYNKAQALIGLDLKNLQKEINDQKDLELAISLKPEELQQHKAQATKEAQHKKSLSLFKQFIGLYGNDLHQADNAFQDLMKQAKVAQASTKA